MAAISAAMVNQLRQMSGQGMMDCKQALQETGRREDCRPCAKGLCAGAYTGLQKQGVLCRLTA